MGGTEIPTTKGRVGTSTTLLPPPPPPVSPPRKSTPTPTTNASVETTTGTIGHEETTDRIQTRTTQNNSNVAESLCTDELHDLLLKIEEGDEEEDDDGDTDCC